MTPLHCGLVSRTQTVPTCSQDVSATGCAIYHKQVGTMVNMPSITRPGLTCCRQHKWDQVGLPGSHHEDACAASHHGS